MVTAEAPQRVCALVGLNTGASTAERMARDASDFGFGDEGVEPVWHTLDDMDDDPDAVLADIEGSFLVVSSAAHGFLPTVLESKKYPSEVASCNPPGETPEWRLVYGAAKRSAVHGGKVITGPNRRVNWDITKDTRLSAAHPMVTLERLRKISKYRSAEWLQGLVALGIAVAVLTGLDDEFGETFIQEGEKMGRLNRSARGCHDLSETDSLAAFGIIDSLHILRRRVRPSTSN